MYEYGNFNSLNIEDVLPNRFQPRIHFDENKLNELAESIRKYGVIQPIVVRQIGDKYEIIAGERRYKASKLANKSTIPAIVINLNDKESEEIALLENVQRQNLTPIEEAVSYKRILDMGYITQAELAEKLGKTQSTIANKVRLLNLDDQVQYALLNGQVSERHARSLLRIHDKNVQVEMLNKIINERLTVKKTDDAIKELLENKDVKPMENTEINENKINEENVNNTNQFLELSNELDTQLEEKVKAPVVKSDPVEDLFGENETIKKPVRAVARGSHEIIRVSLPKDLEEKLMGKEAKSMDIDKIMNEAQDINLPQENKDISELMRQENSVANTFEQSELANENVSPEVLEDNNEIPLVNEEQNKFINFSGIIQPEETVKPEPPVTNEVSFDSIFNQTPVDLQPINPEPIMVAQSVNDDLSEEKNDVSNVSFESSVNNSVSTSIADAVQRAMNSNAPEVPTALQSEIPDVVSEPFKDDIIDISNNVNKSTLYNELVEPDPIQQPAQILEPQVPINPEPIMDNSKLESNLMENVASPVAIPEPIEISNGSLFEVPTEPVITDIPSSDILEAPASTTMASSVNENVATIPTNSNNFIEVIRLIRNCADEIEKLGYSIDLDEIDLGNSYQATFKINK